MLSTWTGNMTHAFFSGFPFVMWNTYSRVGKQWQKIANKKTRLEKWLYLPMLSFHCQYLPAEIDWGCHFPLPQPLAIVRFSFLQDQVSRCSKTRKLDSAWCGKGSYHYRHSPRTCFIMHAASLFGASDQWLSTVSTDGYSWMTCKKCRLWHHT